MTNPTTNGTEALAEEKRPATINDIRHLVDRLTIPTLPPVSTDTGNGRRPVTREPLLAELRAAIRPDQGGTDSGRGGSANTRVPIDADALDLYEDITGQIEALHLMATDRSPRATPEQLLQDWFRTFLVSHTAGDTIPAQIANYHDKLSRFRHRLEAHFQHPRIKEITEACPNCGYTHVIDQRTGGQVRTLTMTWWPDNPDRGMVVSCRSCLNTWPHLEALHLNVTLANGVFGATDYELDDGTTHQRGGE